LPFQGEFDTLPYTQGDCPGLTAAGLSGRSPSSQSISCDFKFYHFDTPFFAISTLTRMEKEEKDLKMKEGKSAKYSL